MPSRYRGTTDRREEAKEVPAKEICQPYEDLRDDRNYPTFEEMLSSLHRAVNQFDNKQTPKGLS